MARQKNEAWEGVGGGGGAAMKRMHEVGTGGDRCFSGKGREESLDMTRFC